MFNREEARGLTATFVFKIADDVFTARIVDGALEPSLGAADDADLVVETDAETFFMLCAGQLEPRAALAEGRIAVTGDESLLERCYRVFTFAPRIRVAA